jgi:type II secretory ATPase GspE/PulE/Tfp pilus assembly ATPase PilB-like protein
LEFTVQKVLIELATGHQLEGKLGKPFRPEDPELIVHIPQTHEPRRVPLEKVCCIRFREALPVDMEPREGDMLEEVEIITGKLFHVRPLKKYFFSTGFYAVDVDEETADQLMFFSLAGVRMRKEYRRLGEILEAEGIVEKKHIDDALAEQERLQKRRVGEVIIAREKGLEQENVEKAIVKARQDKHPRQRIMVGDILVTAGLISQEQLTKALAQQKKEKNKKLGDILVERGLVTKAEILTALATKFRQRFVNLDDITPDPKALSAISEDMVRQLKVFPFKDHGDRIVVANSTPTDPTIGDALRFHAGRRIELVVSLPEQINEYIERYYTAEDQLINYFIGEMSADIKEVAEEEDNDVGLLKETDSGIIKLVNKLLVEAYHKGASDIHIEPGMGREDLKVRYRIDGVCSVVHVIPMTYKKAIIARIKILSNLNIAEHRLPQSGKIMIRYKGKKIEYRVEVTPTVGGNEDAVLRVLASSRPLPLDQMGFSDWNLEQFRKIIKKPYGIVLCVGPTGSGKTTTLHSGLGYINTPDRKIWTAEDPVEITQDGLRQVQVLPKIGFTFGEALRSFLRADPDIIMIGEMRDRETAAIAVESSLTGHLVFSTLHTNSAPETVVRLVEIGLDPFNFADALLGILAQRLARRICNSCKEPYSPTEEEYKDLQHFYGESWYEKHQMPALDAGFTLMKATGCKDCDGGYKGRLALHELLIATPEVKNSIKANAGVEELRDLAIDQGMRTLQMDGVAKVLQGHSSLEQIMRVCL